MIQNKKKENRKKYFLLRNHLDFIKLSNKMFDQQMWCWGCDIRNNSGNKMIEYGFNKVRTSDDKDVPSQYSINYKDHLILLWGFGGLIRQNNNKAIFIRRYDFYPKRLESVPENFLASDIKDIKKYFVKDKSLLYEIDYNLLSIFYDLIIDYEHWIIKQMGTEYRQHTLNIWIKKKIVNAENLISTWKDLYDFTLSKMLKVNSAT